MRDIKLKRKLNRLLKEKETEPIQEKKEKSVTLRNNNENNELISTGAISFFLFTLLLAERLDHNIASSWIWVCSPVWSYLMVLYFSLACRLRYKIINSTLASTVLTVFVFLKLTDKIGWSWIWVWSPVWINLIYFFIWVNILNILKPYYID